MILCCLGSTAEAQPQERRTAYPDTRKLVVLDGEDVAAAAVARLPHRRVIEYPDRRVYIVSQSELGKLGPARLRALPLRDRLDEIQLRRRTLRSNEPPSPTPRMLADERTNLFLVQHPGPVKAEWLSEVRDTDARVISYVANNAYLVWADAATVTKLDGLLGRSLQYRALFEPADRLDPRLDAVDEPWVDVTVQLVDHEDVATSIATLRATAQRELEPAHRLGPYRNLRLRVPTASLQSIAAHPDVVFVEPFHEPVLLGERQGQILAGQLAAPGDQPTGPGYLTWLTGLGFGPTFRFAVDVSDESIDRGLVGSADVHPDLLDGGGASRVVYQHRVSGSAVFDNAGTSPDGGGHGTIDAGIVAARNVGTGAAYEDGAGFNYGLGVAPFARLGSSEIFDPWWTSPNPSELANAAYQRRARISNNSWGAGWPTSAYDATSQAYDALARDARPAWVLDGGTPGNQEMTFVFSAGNRGPGAGTLGDRGSTAKNTLVVAASENYNLQGGADGCDLTDADADDARDLADFSSRGPTQDGRTKPDLAAPGVRIQGIAPQHPGFAGSFVCDAQSPPGQTLYSMSTGTSHAAPAVAGAAALLRQWSIDRRRPSPSPAMTKAFLMNSTVRLTGAGANDDLPSSTQGMGRMDLGRTFDGVPRILVDQSHLFSGTGQTFVVTGSVTNAASPFRVTLAWTDAPGPLMGNPVVNDLDLEVSFDPGGGALLYRGNHFMADSSQTGGTADALNNVESVWLPAGTTGTFTITVRAANIAGDGVPGTGGAMDQDFALVVYNVAESCGDGYRTIGEECDDGGTTPGDGCDASCQVEAGFQCWGHSSLCAPGSCGDSVIGPGEECDDGGATPGDGCDELCLAEWYPNCGNDELDPDEECDDGGIDPGDGCDASCHKEPDWTCTGAPSQCWLCGDGVVSPGEGCDDGSTDPGDGCSEACQLEGGWCCTGEPSVCTLGCEDGVCVSCAKITPTDGTGDRRFGSGVDLLDGVLAVGQCGYTIPRHLATSAGSVYVFGETGQGWSEIRSFDAPDGLPGDYLGFEVVLDGVDRVLTGAHYSIDNGDRSGSAHVFELGSHTEFHPSPAEEGDRFGASLSLDGDRLVVSANGGDTHSAFVFERGADPEDWVQQAELVVSTSPPYVIAGLPVEISGDVIVLGARGDPSVGGSVHVWRFDDPVWQYEVELQPGDLAPLDTFGRSIALDGDRLLVGADQHDSAGEDAGAVYYYEFDGAQWQLEQKIVASDAVAFARFGYELDLLGDRLLVGAVQSTDVGAYVFERNAVTHLWEESWKLLPADPDPTANFGNRFAQGGNRIFVSAETDHETGQNAGAVYEFRIPEDHRLWLLPATAGSSVLEAELTLHGVTAYSDPLGVVTPEVVLDSGDPGDDVTVTLRMGELASVELVRIPWEAGVVTLEASFDAVDPDFAPRTVSVTLGVLPASGPGVGAFTYYMPTLSDDPLHQVTELGPSRSPEDNDDQFLSDVPTIGKTDPGAGFDVVTLDDGFGDVWYASVASGGPAPPMAEAFGLQRGQICGDAVVEPGPEQCDEGGPTASCDADCTHAYCGDGQTNALAAEGCDDGGESAVCNPDCTLAACGDDMRNATAGEDCDGGDDLLCPGLCDLSCACPIPVCGNGILEPALEECDDGDLDPGDGCDETCAVEAGTTCWGTAPSVCSLCGNGLVEGLEDCDGAGETATCDDDCTFAQCLDGTVNPTASEQCDPGDVEAGCNANTCLLQPGWVCFGEPSVCEPGVPVDGSGVWGDRFCGQWTFVDPLLSDVFGGPIGAPFEMQIDVDEYGSGTLGIRSSFIDARGSVSLSSYELWSDWLAGVYLEPSFAQTALGPVLIRGWGWIELFGPLSIPGEEPNFPSGPMDPGSVVHLTLELSTDEGTFDAQGQVSAAGWACTYRVPALPRYALPILALAMLASAAWTLRARPRSRTAP